MCACYSVTLHVCVIDEQGAIKALNKKIKTEDGRGVNYNLEKWKSQGFTTETFDDLMKIFLADCDKIEGHEGFTYYSNAFNASYGYESVMMEMFETITPFVEDGSKLLIYPDSDYDELIVKEGKCVQIH